MKMGSTGSMSLVVQCVPSMSLEVLMKVRCTQFCHRSSLTRRVVVLPRPLVDLLAGIRLILKYEVFSASLFFFCQQNKRCNRSHYSYTCIRWHAQCELQDMDHEYGDPPSQKKKHFSKIQVYCNFLIGSHTAKADAYLEKWCSAGAH